MELISQLFFSLHSMQNNLRKRKLNEEFPAKIESGMKIEFSETRIGNCRCTNLQNILFAGNLSRLKCNRNIRTVGYSEIHNTSGEKGVVIKLLKIFSASETFCRQHICTKLTHIFITSPSSSPPRPAEKSELRRRKEEVICTSPVMNV